MTVAKGFLIVLLSGIGFAIGGGLIGYALAVLAPGYYRGVFSSGREPWFDPIQIGIGLGISQGVICGIIIGAVIVLAVAWYSSRRSLLDVQVLPRQSWLRCQPAATPTEEQRITGQR